MVSVIVWPRYELLTPLILHKPPSGNLCPKLTYSHLLKFATYIRARTKTSRPRLDYTVWRHVATSKLGMEEDIAWLYFECFDSIRGASREERLDDQKRLSTVRSELDLAEQRKSVSVDALSFILFLFLQTAPFSGKTFSPDTGWPEVNIREGQRHEEEFLFLNFIKTSTKDILQLLSEAPSRASESTMSMECLDCLDLVFACSMNGRVSPHLGDALLAPSNVPDCGYSDDSNSFCTTALSSWLLIHLSVSPYGISSIMDGQRDRMNYFFRSSYRGRVCGNYSIAPLGHQITVLDQVPRQTIILESRETQISYAFIRKCRDAHIFLLTPHRSVVIERCFDCEICLAPVDSCLVIKKSENVIVRCFARKVVLSSLKECKLFINTPTQPIFLNSNSNIQLSPFNTHYPSLEKQLLSYPMSGINLWDYPTILSADTSQVGAKPFQLIEPSSFTISVTPLSSPGRLSLPYSLPRRFKEALANQKNYMREWGEMKGTLESSEEQALRQALEENFSEWISADKLSSKIQQMFVILDKHSTEK